MLIQNNNSTMILKVVVVLFFLQVNHSDALDTGYKNNQLKCVENVKLLKCSYLLYALNYMQVARLEIHHPNFNYKKTYYKDQCNYNIIQDMMSTIYGLQVVEMGSLWLLNIYLGNVCRLFVKFHQSQIYEHLKLYLKDTHDIVLDALKSEISSMKCNKEKNKFYVDERNLKKLNNCSLKDISSYMFKKSQIMRNFILKNTELSKINCRKFAKKNIFIRNISDDQNYMNFLMNGYNVQVNWGGIERSTMLQLRENYENAHRIDWGTNKLNGIQIYYESVFSFLKVIMLRLTWKHFLYVNKQKNKFIKECLVDKWIAILIEFGKYLHLKEDDFVYKVKNTIETQRDVDDYLLKSYLNTLCLDLGCNALKEMKLDGKEYSFKNSKQIQTVHNETELETVNYYSLGAAEHFIIDIKKLFEDQDFNVIKSLIDFADKNKLFDKIEKKIKYVFSLSDI
ncbi:uncharacterized protein LOC126903643 isoform X1 [Daktulosphaira vitifoliae]|uniref:uncharacterized protein LOC126903643 isoform X1 n=1 Tax=Daktulosphaira vitifoliae TaxID=58002 RepID=UPI0021AA4C0C|nr:uncharacterized protein LOC126903643 isoform X1 [Daktulosphaira vitifoliae]XP_050537939.1 uncharacterized protein LOC126903643 isoform X1 [Daktulosphaira vitifoliae]